MYKLINYKIHCKINSKLLINIQNQYNHIWQLINCKLIRKFIFFLIFEIYLKN